MTPETLTAIQTLSGIGGSGLLIWFIFIIKKQSEEKDKIIQEQNTYIRQLNEKFENLIVKNTEAIATNVMQGKNMEEAVKNNTRTVDSVIEKLHDIIKK